MLGASAYQNNKVNQWTSSIVEQCLNQLTKLGKPFKYIGELKGLESGVSKNSCYVVVGVGSNMVFFTIFPRPCFYKTQ